MSIIRSLFGGPPVDKRALSFSQIFGHDLAYYGLDDTGVIVNTESARRVMAVWACQSLISGDLATLPFGAKRKLSPSGSEDMPTPEWLRRPDPLNPNFTRSSYLRQVALSLLQDGNAFIAAVPDVFTPTGLRVLNPAQVDIKDGPDGPIYAIRGRTGGELGTLSAADIIHIPFILPPGQQRGLNPIQAADRGIALSIAAEKQQSDFFGGGGLVTGVIEVPQGTEMTEPQLDELRDSFKRKRSGPTGYSIGALTGGATFRQVMLSQQDAQSIETRKYSLEEIARLYLVPPFMIGSQEPAGVAYASSVERAKHYIDHCLIHYSTPIELGHDRLLPTDDTFTKFNFGGLLRGSLKDRLDAYATGLQNKIMFQEQVRDLEDWPPIPDDATLLETPNNSGVPQRGPTQRDLELAMAHATSRLERLDVENLSLEDVRSIVSDSIRGALNKETP